MQTLGYDGGYEGGREKPPDIPMLKSFHFGTTLRNFPAAEFCSMMHVGEDCRSKTMLSIAYLFHIYSSFSVLLCIYYYLPFVLVTNSLTLLV
jgi:hypothetical protein